MNTDQPVQLREDVAAKVWVFDKDGKRVEAEVVLKAGGYYLNDN